MRGIWIGVAAVVVAVAIALGLLLWEGGAEREAQAPSALKTTQTESSDKTPAGAVATPKAPADVAAPARPSSLAGSDRASTGTTESQPIQKQASPRQAKKGDLAKPLAKVEVEGVTPGAVSQASKPISSAPGVVASLETPSVNPQASPGPTQGSAAEAGKSDVEQPENKAKGAGETLSALQPSSTGISSGDVTAKTSPTTPATMAPSFDVVRISQQCTAVFAGRAQPRAVVTVWDGDQPLGQVKADGNGEWVFVVDKPLRSGARQLSLIAELPGEAPVRSASVAVIVVPDCTDPALTPKREQAIAVLTPRKGGASKVLQPPAAKGDTSKAKGLSLDSVDYDDKGDVVLSGRAEPGTSVRAYVNNEPVGEAKTNTEGDWQVKPSQPVDPGVHKLRIDQVASEGEVVARVELPFSRADPSEIVIAAGHVVVQPGNSLWRIARRTYGEGLKFTVIYQANRQSIADPDLIYPGQIFSLPQVN